MLMLLNKYNLLTLFNSTHFCFQFNFNHVSVRVAKHTFYKDEYHRIDLNILHTILSVYVQHIIFMTLLVYD